MKRSRQTRIQPRQSAATGLIPAYLLLALLPLGAASAETEGFYIETINRGTGLMGDTSIEELSKTYLAGERMKIVNEGEDATDMIMDRASGVMTIINHPAKEYLPIDVKSVMETMAGPAGEQMRNMMGDSQVRVVETGETKKIGAWTTREYRLTRTGMVGIEKEIWATEEIDLDLTHFSDMMGQGGPGGFLGNSPAGLAQQEEMAKIKGYPILTKTRMEMMGSRMETETEVVLIRKEMIPDTLFEVPAGYTPREMGTGMPLPGQHPPAH